MTRPSDMMLPPHAIRLGHKVEPQWPLSCVVMVNSYFGKKSVDVFWKFERHYYHAGDATAIGTSAADALDRAKEHAAKLAFMGFDANTQEANKTLFEVRISA